MEAWSCPNTASLWCVCHKPVGREKKGGKYWRILLDSAIGLCYMESRMDQMEAKLNQVESDVREMKLTIENEICVNIQRVAEGHLDLSRNLHEAMKVETEKEMLSIRVNVLESEMRRVKEHLQIA